MASTLLQIQHNNAANFRGRRGKDLLRVVVNKLNAGLIGSEPGLQFTVTGSGTELASACTCGISASASGTVGITIAGVANTAATGASDTITAGLIAAAINANTNAKIQYLIGATNLKSSLTFSTVLAGTVINLGGYRFTAVAGTAAAIQNNPGDFVISGTDTQDAASFCGAVNQHPYASKYFFALNVAGVCHVFPKAAAWWTSATAGTVNFPQNFVTASATTVTVGSATFAASDYYGVWCKIPGKLGNNIVVAASGTGQSIENSNTYLSRGLGGDAAPTTDTL